MVKIGEITEMFTTSFVWAIHDFYNLSETADVYFDSPTFEFAKANWFLRLYPNGQNKHNSSGWMSFYLYKKKSDGTKQAVTYTLSIKDKDGRDYMHQDAARYVFRNEDNWGWHKYVLRTSLLEQRSKLAPEGILTVACTAVWNFCASEIEQPIPVPERDVIFAEPKMLWEALNKNLTDLFQNQKDCDVIIKVKDQEFKAHRLILKARSTVFAAMFEHDLAENRTGEVKIADAEPEAFRNVLLYIYSGKVETLSSENVYELYSIADMYNLSDLKQECVKFMEITLTVESVFDVLVLADRYSEAKLKEQAKEFVIKNWKTVIALDKYEKFEAENQALAIQTLKSIVIDKA